MNASLHSLNLSLSVDVKYALERLFNRSHDLLGMTYLSPIHWEFIFYNSYSNWLNFENKI